MPIDKHEPHPNPGKEDVYKMIIENFMPRIELGKQKYGTHLQTFNGRNPAMDTYQEVFDALLYSMQTLKQYNFLLLFARMMIDKLIKLGVWHKPEFDVLRELYEDFIEKAGQYE